MLPSEFFFLGVFLFGSFLTDCRRYNQLLRIEERMMKETQKAEYYVPNKLAGSA